MKYLKTFVYAVLAGLCIAIGGTVFLSVDQKVIGALLFTVGLFAICAFGFNLFTGKVCYVFEQDASYAFGLPVIWIGNFVGTWLTAKAETLTRIGPALQQKAQALCGAKLADNLMSIFILAVFCNILIFIAVDGYKSIQFPEGKLLALFFGVTVFILCGFEHCVANIYYISIADMWSGKAFAYILVMTAGNAVGGVSIPLLKKLSNGCKGPEHDANH